MNNEELKREAEERARDFTDNEGRQVAYECGFLDGAGRMKEEMQKQINKMKCCENCKHHYWLYEELACRIYKIDVDTCNSWEVKEND